MFNNQVLYAPDDDTIQKEGHKVRLIDSIDDILILFIIILKFKLIYSFETTKDSVGEYTCIANNELGSGQDSILLKLSTSEIDISTKMIFSDAFEFEWSCLSGSQLKQMWIEVKITLIWLAFIYLFIFF